VQIKSNRGDSMTEELKPCPFCGYALPFEEGICPPLLNEEEDTELTPWLIGCSNCGCGGPPELSEQKAIKAWNTRA
jgi:Lar family restriction alleviation protein